MDLDHGQRRRRDIDDMDFCRFDLQMEDFQTSRHAPHSWGAGHFTVAPDSTEVQNAGCDIADEEPRGVTAQELLAEGDAARSYHLFS